MSNMVKSIVVSKRSFRIFQKHMLLLNQLYCDMCESHQNLFLGMARIPRVFLREVFHSVTFTTVMAHKFFEIEITLKWRNITIFVSKCSTETINMKQQRIHDSRFDMVRLNAPIRSIKLGKTVGFVYWMHSRFKKERNYRHVTRFSDSSK